MTTKHEVPSIPDKDIWLDPNKLADKYGQFLTSIVMALHKRTEELSIRLSRIEGERNAAKMAKVPIGKGT